MVPSWSNSTSRTSISPDRSCGSNSISVVVSDDESDEPSRMRFRVTKKTKRRKDRRPNFCFRALRNISKWWFCLLLLPALVLVYFELFKTAPHGPRETREKFLSNSSRAVISREKGTEISEKGGESNLNRLDMPTRSVNGVREPCLKLLPPEDIEHLELPFAQTSDIPVRNVVYAVLESRDEVGDNSTAFKQLEMESQNFNLFTGNQTLHERQESFKVISCLQTPDISEIFVGVQMFGQILLLMQQYERQ